MKEFLDRPGFLGTYGTLGVDVTFIAAIFFTVLFMIGWYYARKGRGNAHHTLTVWAMLAMIGYFLFYYISRQLGGCWQYYCCVAHDSFSPWVVHASNYHRLKFGSDRTLPNFT